MNYIFLVVIGILIQMFGVFGFMVSARIKEEKVYEKYIYRHIDSDGKILAELHSNEDVQLRFKVEVTEPPIIKQ